MLVADFGLQMLGVREVARLRYEPAKLSSLVSGILSIQLALMATGFVVVNAFNWIAAPYDGQTKWLMTLFSASMMFPYVPTIEWCLNGIERLSLSALGRLIREILSLGLIFVLVQGAAQVVYVPLSQAAATLAVSAWMVWYFVRVTGARLRLNLSLQQWRSLLGRSWPLGAAVVLGQYCLRSGVITMGFLSTSNETGIFVAASRLLTYGNEFLSVLIFATLPVLTRLFDDDRERFRVAGLKLQIFLLVISSVLLLSAFVLAAPTIAFIYGPAYQDSQEPFALLVIAFAVSLFASGFYLPLLAAHQDRIILVQNIIAAAVVTVFNVLLIPHMGATGAALSFLLAVMMVALYLIFSYFRVRVQFEANWRGPQI